VNSQVPARIRPNGVLRVVGDPTNWGLLDVVPPRPGPGDDPISLAVIGPLAGTLLLSPRHAAGLVFTTPDYNDGWMPAMAIPFPFLYLPSTLGVHATSPIYELVPGVTPSELEDEVMGAMRAGTRITVELATIGLPDYLVINGAELPFVVIGPAV
jgi:hypothetical protein